MILPGDILWDRFRVVRVEADRSGCAWLAPLHAPGSEGRARATHLLLTLDPKRRSALGELLAVVWRGVNVPSEKPSTAVVQNGEPRGRLPLFGEVEWRGAPASGGVVLLESMPAMPWSDALVDPDAPPVANALNRIASLAASVERLLSIASAAPNGRTEFCRAAATLLNPHAMQLDEERLRLIFSDQSDPIVLPVQPNNSAHISSPIAPPAWTSFAAPEVIAGNECGEPALIFGIGQMALALLFGTEKSASDAPDGWARLATPGIAFKNFQRDPRTAKLPKEVSALLGKCLRPLPAQRFASVAKFRAALKKVQRAVGERGDPGAMPFAAADAIEVKVEIPSGMKLIPAGPYLAGEKKIPRTLRAFAIDAQPVTERDYRDFLKALNREPYPDGPGSRGPKFDKHPVVNVTWREAEEYAEHFGKRLPTVYEWEKAARGNDGRKFPYGNEFLSGTGRMRANGINTAPGKEALKETAPAGSFPKGASPYGMLDAAGNVLEWTSTARRLGERIFRALKGACFLDGSVELSRCTTVQYKTPSARENCIGFRCVKDVD